MSEEEQLRALCERLGSSPAQAVTMAAQLQKREAALAHLLNLVVKGRSGEVPPDFLPPAGPRG
jgi:hypothetical protein